MRKSNIYEKHTIILPMRSLLFETNSMFYCPHIIEMLAGLHDVRGSFILVHLHPALAQKFPEWGQVADSDKDNVVFLYWLCHLYSISHSRILQLQKLLQNQANSDKFKGLIFQNYRRLCVRDVIKTHIQPKSSRFLCVEHKHGYQRNSLHICLYC